MCLIALHWNPKLERKLTLLSNRDEFYARPSQTAQWWEDQPHIFGGRDLEQGGSWLAISASGRMAAVTNYREVPAPEGSISRGALVSGFLNSELNAQAFCQLLAQQAAHYAGFNAFFYDGVQLIYASNRYRNFSLRVPPGTHVLSNHLLNTPWPKVEALRLRFKTLISSQKEEEIAQQQAFEMMEDRELAPDEQLPETGVAPEIEKMLSAAFISSPNYGTRTTSLLELNSQGFRLTERNHVPEVTTQEHRINFS